MFDDHDDPVSPDMWRVGETLIRNDWPDMLIGPVCYDPTDVKYAMFTDNHGEVSEKYQVCPAVPEMHDWDRHEALGGDRYGYYGDFDSRSK